MYDYVWVSGDGIRYSDYVLKNISELEDDFLSSTCVRDDEANSMLCITIDLDKFQFDKHIGVGG